MHLNSDFKTESQLLLHPKKVNRFGLDFKDQFYRFFSSVSPKFPKVRMEHICPVCDGLQYMIVCPLQEVEPKTLSKLTELTFGKRNKPKEKILNLGQCKPITQRYMTEKHFTFKESEIDYFCKCFNNEKIILDKKISFLIKIMEKITRNLRFFSTKLELIEIKSKATESIYNSNSVFVKFSMSSNESKCTYRIIESRNINDERQNLDSNIALKKMVGQLTFLKKKFENYLVQLLKQHKIFQHRLNKLFQVALLLKSSKNYKKKYKLYNGMITTISKVVMIHHANLLVVLSKAAGKLKNIKVSENYC